MICVTIGMWNKCNDLTPNDDTVWEFTHFSRHLFSFNLRIFRRYVV